MHAYVNGRHSPAPELAVVGRQKVARGRVEAELTGPGVAIGGPLGPPAAAGEGDPECGMGHRVTDQI